VAPAKFDGAAIARRQRFIFIAVATMPDRTDGMDHMTSRQPITFGDFGIAGLAAPECAAFGEKPGTSRAMDRTVDATAAE
jgi:hypothetical protein